MSQPLVSTLTESAVRLDPRDSREYAGNQEDSPLYDICEHPERHDNVRDYDGEIVVVDDANAKSPDHVIIMPRDTSIKEIANLTTQHLPLLYRFRARAQSEIHRMLREDPNRIPLFMTGFHTIPSLFPLHLHVQDWSLSTDKMFHPRHWKVPFSNMFISLEHVIAEIERTGHITIDAEAYREEWASKPIRCPVCPGPQPQWESLDISELANHWRDHIAHWKSTNSLPAGTHPTTGLWTPTFPVILTTKRRGGMIGFPSSPDNQTAELPPSLSHLQTLYPSLEIHSYHTDDWPTIPKYILNKTTIYLSTTELPPPQVHLPRLQWIHLASSGLDLLNIPSNNILYNRRPGLQLTSSTGAGSAALAEWAVMNTMLLSRNMLTALRHQAQKEWNPQGLMGYRTLSELSVGVIGFGSIGQSVAERFLGMGCTSVSALNPAGLPPPSSRGTMEQKVHVIRATGPGALHAFLQKQDVVVLAAPLTQETVGLLGAKEFAAMKQGALVVNVARGPLIDEDALVKYLRNGHLGGAALDVAVEEPLGKESPLWGLENVIITPHVAVMHGKYNDNMLSIFEENVRAHLDGRPKRNMASLPVVFPDLPKSYKPPTFTPTAPTRTPKVVYAVRERQ
ncbi:D-isomer specific 2-hydroxyacid dehydrogenase [Chaetomium sp. MPI-SDFR-AT-0129]|nr:D-isomer specific 2-hydroxyacid dehydrogenase [Chaetomium sp. MPI-SDFR-AT-0129]